MLKRRFIFVWVVLFAGLNLLSAKDKDQPITVAAQVYGSSRNMVYFDGMQSPLVRAEFHTNPGEDHIYTFSSNQISSLTVNGSTELLLMPGDSLHVVIRYEGRQVKSVDFSGTDAAVQRNRVFRAVARIRQDMRYKTQLLACVAVDVKPKDRLADSRLLLDKVKALLAKAQGLEPEAADYIMAATEASVYESFMEYPVMYAEVRRTPLHQQEIGDYARLMDGVDLRKPAPAALRHPAYLGMLMRKVFYDKETQAQAAGSTYRRPQSIEETYATMAGAFKKHPARDAVLYRLLCNYILQGQKIEKAEPLIKDFRKKAKKNKDLVAILDSLME